jgi:hypothetical protein
MFTPIIIITLSTASSNDAFASAEPCGQRVNNIDVPDSLSAWK